MQTIKERVKRNTDQNKHTKIKRKMNSSDTNAMLNALSRLTNRIVSVIRNKYKIITLANMFTTKGGFCGKCKYTKSKSPWSCR